MIGKTAVRITIGLAVLVLVPILVVIGLGAYGQSLGGMSTGRARQGAVLTVLPSSGRPGSILRVEGAGWPPRSEIRLDFMRASRDGISAGPPIRFGGILTSRSGKFSSEVVLPKTLPMPAGSQLQIAATAIANRDRDVQAITQFEVEAFDNELVVEAIDPISGTRISGAQIEIRDRFQRLVARGETGSDGAVRFVGLFPSSGYATTARISGRKIFRSTEFSMPESGISTVTAELFEARRERFFIGGHFYVEDNALELVGVDVAAELPVTERVELAPWARTALDLGDSDSGGSLFFNTRQTLAGIFGSTTDRPDATPQDLQLAISALQVADPVGTTSLIYQPAEGRYLGRHPTTGGLIVSMNDGLQVGIAHISPISGAQTWAVSVVGTYSGPFLSHAADKAVIFGLRDSSMVEIDLTDATVTRADLVDVDPPITVGIDNRGRWVAFSIPSGRLYRIDSDMSVAFVATLPELRNQDIALEPDPTSARILFLSPRHNLAYVVDGESGTTTAIIPTEARIDEALFSRDGNRVFLASRQDRTVYVYAWPELRLLDAISLPKRSPAR